MKSLKHILKPDLLLEVQQIHSIYGGVVLPPEMVAKASSLMIWVESFEDEDTVYSLLNSLGDVVFETRIS
jgi:hypothetical protein